MIKKILGAFSFRPGVYTEVKKDAGFNGSAWLIIFATSFLVALGSNTSLLRSGQAGSWFLGAIAATLFMVLGFTLACFVIQWLGKNIFNTSVTMAELVRPFGLARVWMALTFVGILTAISPTLACVTGVAGLAACMLWFLAWMIAVRETMGLEWLQSVSVVIVGLLVMVAISIISNSVLGLFNLVGSSLLRIFG